MAEEKAPGIVKTMKFGDEEFEVPFAKGNPGKTREELDAIKRKLAEEGGASDGEMVATMGYCAPYQPHTYMTELQDVLCERDQACVLRDGTTIYADIYRPANTTEKVPVICVFAPFGKTPPRAWILGSSWAFRRRRFPSMPSSRLPTRAIGAAKATRLRTSIRAVWAIPRVTYTCGAVRTHKTAMTSSNGLPHRNGATARRP